jgi:hypothetical protein
MKIYIKITIFHCSGPVRKQLVGAVAPYQTAEDQASERKGRTWSPPVLRHHNISAQPALGWVGGGGS